MKKLILTAALASVVAVSNAQELTSKKGIPILPEAGEYSIGFDAVPFLDWAFDKSRVMSNTAVTSAGTALTYQVPMTLVGKYMIDANTAYRGKLRIGINSQSIDNMVDDNGSTTAGATVTDTWKHSSMDVTLSAGKQWYRGKGRLRGYYGAEALLMFGSDKHTYSYGNAFSASNNNPTSTDFNYVDPSGNFGTISNPATSGRVTEEKQGGLFGFGIRGFVGAEYFFAAKMSVGAEYGWGLNIMSYGEGSNSYEFLNTAGTGGETRTGKVGKRSSTGLDVDNASGAIYLSLYF
jgi:hypothetical protein